MQKLEHRLAARQKRLRKLFDQTDIDGNGTLDPGELQILIARTFRKASLNFDETVLLEFSKKLITNITKNSNSEGKRNDINVD